MRRLGLLLALLLGACGSGGQAPTNASRHEAARPMPSPPPAAPAVKAAENMASEVPADDPGLADLSPAQRRAYQLGYRDCSQGRYAPAEHLEAYRIGCAAAHDH